MFLSQKNYSLEDFLQSLQFIAPKGTSVAYFISPQETVLPQNSGFSKQPETPEDESITYIRQEPIMKQDQAQTPAEYSTFDPGDLGRRQPTPNILPQITEPKDLDSPFVKVLSESKMYGTEIILLENYNMFEKGTLFHCVSTKLK